jgi:zinc transport system substrate-binding protein
MHAAEYQTNLARFLADIDALDRDITRLLSGIGQRRFLVYHPAWGYFAKQYGLEQVAIEAEGKEPSPVRLMALVRWAREQSVKTVFVQKGFSTKGAEAIAREIGGGDRSIRSPETGSTRAVAAASQGACRWAQ